VPNIPVDSVAIDLARRLEQSASLAPTPEADTVSSGPFRCFFSPYTDDDQLNYAMPVARLGSPEELAAAIQAARAVFTERQRTPRFEFVEALWSGLAESLERAGLRLEGREPLMACAPDEFRPSFASDVEVHALTAADSDEDLATFLRIRDEAPAGAEASITSEQIARLRESVRTEYGWFVLATIGRQIAGAGYCQYDGGDLGEIVGIVTVPELRRRGVAASVVSFLLSKLFQNDGSLAWLSAANEQARSVYARLGFRAIGSLLNYEGECEGREAQQDGIPPSPHAGKGEWW